MNPSHTLRRLFEYSRPYRGRLGWAVVAMLFYAAGSAGIAALIQPILDNVLPHRERLALVAWGIIGLNLLKGIGSYGSSYLMTDVGQRVVMDLRNALYRHILGQSAGFFAQRTTGQLMSRINNDVSQVQQAVSETFADLARETLALFGFAALLFYYDAWLAIFCIISAPLIVYPLIRLGQRVRRTTRRSQEALEQLSHISAEGLTGHRIVKAFGNEAREAERFNRAGYHLFRTNMKVTAALSTPAAADGTARRHRHGGRALVRQPRDFPRRTDHRTADVVRRDAVPDVRSGEKIEPRQRQPAAGHGGVRAYFRNARYAHRGR